MLQQIETNGKTYPVNFGIRTLAATADALGMSIDKLTREFLVPDLPVGELIGMIVAVTAVALTEGARKAGAPRIYTQDEVVDLIDEDSGLLPHLVGLFRSSIGDGRPVFPTAAPEPPVTGKPAARKSARKK